MRHSTVTLVAFLFSPLCAASLFAGGLSAEEHREALKKLAAAEREFDVPAFLAACRTVLRGDTASDVRAVVSAYSRVAERAAKDLSLGEFLALHGKCASAFKETKNDAAGAEMAKLLARNRQWQGRLLLLDAAAFSDKLDLLQSCLKALDDEHPIVVRRALHYLARARKRPVVEAIVNRYLALAEKKPKAPDAAQWDRTFLAFRSTLTQLLQVDLPAPQDYQNYLAGRPGDEDIFKAREKAGGELTQITLFGAAVSGKNIVFVLDVSGSMLTTDPAPPGGVKERSNPGRTVVVGGPGSSEPTIPRIPEERRRMARAKKELAKVVRALPEDVRFNMIFYSSDVHPWKPSMAPASEKNKKEAVQFIEAAKAEGITVTDLALEEAFSDLQLDTVYLVTDGAPTHVGSTGPAKPEDADQIIVAIHQRIKELNFLRGVRIFTLGFKDAEEDFLRKLAAENSGMYVAIE